jgi:predicted cupin superfamily sugar epimerase
MTSTRAAELIAELGLRAHPEGGHYAEIFRSVRRVQPGDARPPRPALTSIDFLLTTGQCSAWHRVASDEAWHLLEGPALRLWLAAPDLGAFGPIDLGPVADGRRPRHVVPAAWWQAAEPLGDFAYVGATVGPGFDFADFSFGRDDAAFAAALRRSAPELVRLL